MGHTIDMRPSVNDSPPRTPPARTKVKDGLGIYKWAGVDGESPWTLLKDKLEEDKMTHTKCTCISNFI